MFNVGDEVVVIRRPEGYPNTGWFADRNLNLMVFRVSYKNRWNRVTFSRILPNGKVSSHYRELPAECLRHTNLKPLEDYL